MNDQRLIAIFVSLHDLNEANEWRVPITRIECERKVTRMLALSGGLAEHDSNPPHD
jgi:hypothetical protein